MVSKDKRAINKRYKLKKCNKSKLLRLTVFCSNKNTYAQIIDDSKGFTLVAASSLDKLFCEVKKIKKKEMALKVGRLIAERAHKVGINKVVFDCGHYKFHGRVANIAQGAQENGLVI